MLSDIIDAVTLFFEGVLELVGLPGVALVAFSENVFPPTPSAAVYPLAGKMAYDTGMSPLWVIGAALAGMLVASMGFYTLGYLLGAERVRMFIDRYGTPVVFGVRVKVVTVTDYDRVMRLFERHGRVIVCVGRLVPFIHGLVSIPAGVTRMPLLPFLVYSALGAVPPIAILVMFGYTLGANWEQMLALIDLYESLVTVGIGVAVAAFVVYTLYRRRSRQRLHGAELAHEDAGTA